MKMLDGIKVFFGRDWTKEEKVLLLIDTLLFGMLIGFMWAPIKRGFSWNIATNSYNDGLSDVQEDEAEER